MGEHQPQKRPASVRKNPSRGRDPGVKSPDGALQRLSSLAAGAASGLPAAALQQKAAQSPHVAKADLLQRKADSRNVTGMPDTLKSGIEAESGLDMSGVRVHRNSDAPAKVGAEAFAQGTDIHLGPGQDRHLPHEAWHVVQQAQGRVQPTLQMAGVSINDDRALEAEADAMGKRSARGGEGAQAHPVQMQRASGRGVMQRARGDYKALWDKDPKLAKMSITQVSINDYLTRAYGFEQALGAGLFSHALAHEGANALIDAIETLLGATNQANAVFGSMPNKSEAGAIPSVKVAEARAQGNLREKMYMVYAAIRSGNVAYKLAQRDVVAVPRRQTQGGALVTDAHALTNRHLRRRDSVSTQERQSNWSNLTASDRMTEQELASKNAPLSDRERELIGGSKAPEFVPGSAGYNLLADKRLRDTSSGGGAAKTYLKYQHERLAPLVAGLSGSTDWYFNLARQLNLDNTALQKLRLAALGQMLVNRDHSYHEIMHEARTQGKLNDYVDELPAGYATLAPLSIADIATAANKTELPGDQEAAAFNTQDAKKQAPTGLAQQHGLPTRTGFIHLAGPATHNFFGMVKGTHYPAVLKALDKYNTAQTATSKKDELVKIRHHSQQWLSGHNPGPQDAKKKRLEPLKWLVAKATAMLADKPGPPAPVWVDATYDDPAPDPVAEAALYGVVKDESAAYDPANDRAGGTRLVKHLDTVDAATPGSGTYGDIKEAGYDENNMAMIRGAFVNAGNNQNSMKAAKEFMALSKYTKEGYETYNPVLVFRDDDDKAAYNIAYKKTVSTLPFDGDYRQAKTDEERHKRFQQIMSKSLAAVKKKELPQARKEAELAVRALMRMNPYRGGLLWRGGGTGGGAGITSFSKGFGTSFAAKKGYDPAVCLTKHSSGRDISFISSNSGELEVVFPPGTNFNETERHKPGQWPEPYRALGGGHANLKHLLLVSEA